MNYNRRKEDEQSTLLMLFIQSSFLELNLPRRFRVSNNYFIYMFFFLYLNVVNQFSCDALLTEAMIPWGTRPLNIQLTYEILQNKLTVSKCFAWTFLFLDNISSCCSKSNSWQSSCHMSTFFCLFYFNQFKHVLGSTFVFVFYNTNLKINTKVLHRSTQGPTINIRYMASPEKRRYIIFKLNFNYFVISKWNTN